MGGADGSHRKTTPRVAPSGGRAWWAHFEFTRTNTTPTFLSKKIEDLREAGATLRNALGAFAMSWLANGFAEMVAQKVDVFLIWQLCSRLDEASCVVPHQVPQSITTVCRRLIDDPRNITRIDKAGCGHPTECLATALDKRLIIRQFWRTPHC